MKRSVIGLMMVTSFIIACKKDSISGIGCYISKYYYTYPSGATDTTEVTYISDDSLSYTTRSAGNKYIYCYKIKGDSLILKEYLNTLSILNFYGGSKLNSQGFSIGDAFFHGNGSVNSTGTSTYNSEGRPVTSNSDYVTYQNFYTNYYDANGNKTYSILQRAGIVTNRDSFVYQYDMSHQSKLEYGYPNAKYYGIPDKNLVLQIRRYDTNTDTLNSYSNYTYVLDPDGYVAQKNTTTTYAGSGGVYTYIEKFSIQCH